MRCIRCGGALRNDRKDFPFQEPDLGAVIAENIPVRACDACDYNEWMFEPKKLRKAIALTLAENEERLSPQEIRYLRKWLDFSGTDFARRRGVRPETVSRWERAAAPQPMELASERFLRLMVACECLRNGPKLDLDTIGTKEPRPHARR